MSDKTKEGISFDSKMDDVFQKNVNDLLTIKEDFAESDLILLDLVEHDPESALWRMFTMYMDYAKELENPLHFSMWLSNKIDIMIDSNKDATEYRWPAYVDDISYEHRWPAHQNDSYETHLLESKGK